MLSYFLPMSILRCQARSSKRFGPFVSILPWQRTSNSLAASFGSATDRLATAESSDVSSPPATKLPEEANIVVVGGGIIGTSVAYHLAKLGVEKVVLLERDRLTSGTTWHAAGLMNAFGSLSSTTTWMRMYTQELYKNILPDETGQSTGWKGIGCIELASHPHRLESYRRKAAFNRFCGVTVQEISPDEVKVRFPLCDVSDILAGFYVPMDGRANPIDACMALATGAKQRGVRIFEQAPAQGIITKPGSAFGQAPIVTGVQLTNGHTIQCQAVVNCAGMWARQFGEQCGVHSIPNQAAEHYYIITEPLADIDPSWPVVEDPSRYVYIRPEGGGLMLGLFEDMGAAWLPSGIPMNSSFTNIEPDIDRILPYLEKAMERVPAVKDVGIRTFFCGPESFTPDGSPIVGECPEVKNYFVAAGMNSLGILSGGGIGMLLAQWVQGRLPPATHDITFIDPRRFYRYQSNPTYRKDRVGETLGDTYNEDYPSKQLQTCRNIIHSPFHERLVTKGAYFYNVSGWESPGWYAGVPGDLATVKQYSFGREHWFKFWEAEHKSCRENVALFDMSFMSKFFVQGYGAGAFLNRLSTANVDGEAGTITYTQWLDERGLMVADLTVAKLNDDQFLVVATDTMRNQVHNHMTRQINPSDHVFITDVTTQYAQLNIQGPNSRSLVQKVTSEPMDAFRFRQAKEIDIGYGRVWCTRITYVGELGYELFVPVEMARQVYDTINVAGEEYSLAHAGLKALGSLRQVRG